MSAAPTIASSGSARVTQSQAMTPSTAHLAAATPREVRLRHENIRVSPDRGSMRLKSGAIAFNDRTAPDSSSGPTSAAATRSASHGAAPRNAALACSASAWTVPAGSKAASRGMTRRAPRNSPLARKSAGPARAAAIAAHSASVAVASSGERAT